MDYSRFHLVARQWLILSGEYIIIIFMVAFLFYDSIFAVFVFAPMFIVFSTVIKGKKQRERSEELQKQFLKSLQSIATTLAAGFSAENAFIETAFDMEKMYGKSSYIVKELTLINNSVTSGMNLNDALSDFAKRTRIKSIEDFVLVFSVASNSGGDFSKTISGCVELLEKQQEVYEETRVLVRGKQLEQRVMSVIPIGIILYLRMSSQNFIMKLYHNYFGVIVMTVCLIVYVLSIYISERMIQKGLAGSYV